MITLTYLSPQMISFMQTFITKVKSLDKLFIAINIIAIAVILSSIIKWRKQKKESRKINNRFNEQGEENKLAATDGPVSFMFVFMLIMIDICWLIIKVI